MFFSLQHQDDFDHYHEPEESITNFTYYLYDLRNQQLALTITVKRTASGNSFSHSFFEQKSFRKAFHQLKKELKRERFTF